MQQFPVLVIGAGERAADGVFFPQYRFDRELFIHKVDHRIIYTSTSFDTRRATRMSPPLDCGTGCPISLTKGFCYFSPVKSNNHLRINK